MEWLWVPILFFWTIGAFPTWCTVYLGLRGSGCGRVHAWAVASGLAIVWPLFVPQYRRYLRRRQGAWVDELETELHALDH